jgi:hypothetical protein
MAIFTIQNNYVVNFRTLISDEFEAGTALVLDSNGFAVKADRSLALFNSVYEQLSKFIGFASGDHQQSVNLISNDPVGSNYVDNNSNLITNNNEFYKATRRSISEFKDENISNRYNYVNSSTINIRGVGVYNHQGEIYITDQFVRVESSFINFDGSVTIDFEPGDLLTYGAGVNAGKLVKVDISMFGPSVVIVGIVEKFDSASNLLHFRNTLKVYNNTSSIVSTNLILNLDASNVNSYSGSGNTWYDLSGNGLNAELQNGVAWVNENGGTMTFDGTNDQAVVADNALLDFPGDFTIEGAVIKQVGGGGWIHRRSSDAEANWVLSTTGGNSMWFLIRYSGSWYPPTLDTWGGENQFTKYNHVVVTRNSGVINCYYNGTLRFTFNNSLNLDTSTGFVIGSWDSYGLWSKLKTPFVRLYSQGLTADQVRQNYNSSMSKLL